MRDWFIYFKKSKIYKIYVCNTNKKSKIYKIYVWNTILLYITKVTYKFTYDFKEQQNSTYNFHIFYFNLSVLKVEPILRSEREVNPSLQILLIIH